MAPLSDLPPMPPVPDDELVPPRRGRATATAGDESDRNRVVVRFNRRMLWWTVSVGWPLAALSYVLTFYLMASFDVSASGVVFTVQFLPLYAALVGTVLLAQGDCLSYNVQRRWVEGGVPQVTAALRRWRDGDRLEYSVYLGRLEIVRPNGKRRTVLRNSITVDQRSWTTFADVYLAHQNEWKQRQEAASTPEPHMPAASQEQPQSAIRVDVRRRFFAVILLIGIACIAADFALIPDPPHSTTGLLGDNSSLLSVAGLAYAVFGAVPLLLDPKLTYELGTGRVTVKPRGLPAREFPRPGDDRLAYSIYNGALYDIRSNGKRRRIATGWAREQVAWKTFVDRFLDERAPTGPRS